MDSQEIKTRLSTILQDVTVAHRGGFWHINGKLDWAQINLPVKEKLRLSKMLTRSGFVYLQSDRVMAYRHPSLGPVERMLGKL